MVARYVWLGVLSFLFGILTSSSLMSRDYTHKSKSDIENNLVSRVVIGVSAILSFFFLIVFTFLWGYRVPEELCIQILTFFSGLFISTFFKKENKTGKEEGKIKRRKKRHKKKQKRASANQQNTWKKEAEISLLFNFLNALIIFLLISLL